jgi:hypothetical protein
VLQAPARLGPSPAPRAQLARAALEKRARTRLSAAVVLFVFLSRLFKTRKHAQLYKTKKTFLSALFV